MDPTNITDVKTVTCGPVFRPKKQKPIPPPLTLGTNNQTDCLTEFAIIATSPRSPLMQKNLPIRKRAYSCSSMEAIHSYARPPNSPSFGILSPTSSQSSCFGSSEDLDPHDSPVTSSLPFPSSPTKCFNSSGTWSHQWPKIVWQCFIQGTKVIFLNGNLTQEWYSAEEIGIKETLALQAEQYQYQKPMYAVNGLRYVSGEQIPTLVPNTMDALLQLQFSPDFNGQPDILVRCSLDHPFFVKDKGWSSMHPELTAKHYGIPCRVMEMGDVCIPPSDNDATLTAEVFENLKSFDLTPEDTSAVFALSSMAKHKNELLTTMSPPASPNKKLEKVETNRPKRPMNGFMLFAKKFRVEYTQMYPGKDNRAISVLLGDKWKKMKNEERCKYAEQARILAEEQKKLHPDCWKRKRSLSLSSS